MPRHAAKSIGIAVVLLMSRVRHVTDVFGMNNLELARSEGFEPPTLGSEDQCSIH